MNPVEDRVRRALAADVIGVSTEDLLASVHRGAARRRSRRTALVAAAAVVLVTGGVAVASQWGDEPSSSPSPGPEPSEDPSLPPGATSGVIDVSVTGAGEVFRLTTNVGCVGCSTVWRQQEDGGWERLHDWDDRNAYGGEIDPSFGPVERLEMATNGRDGWAFGQRLHSTHDGGRTWSQIAFGAGDPSFNAHATHLTTDGAWNLHRSEDFATQVFRSSLAEDDWATVHVARIGTVTDLLTVGDHVILAASDEGLANPRLLVGRDTGEWSLALSQLPMPCQGENRPYAGATEVFVLCDDGEGGAVVYRSVGLASWERFGRNSGTVTDVEPLGDDALLVVGDGTAQLLDGARNRPVDLGLARGEQTFESAVLIPRAWLTTSDSKLLMSDDGGLTWQQVD